jgi:hypothetical protein
MPTWASNPVRGHELGHRTAIRADALGWRAIGIFGYTIVFALTCIPLSRTFVSARRTD